MITRPNTKINLGLNVLRRRSDGYHDIETLFVPYFELCDSLEIVAGDDFSRVSARLFGEYGGPGEVSGESLCGGPGEGPGEGFGEAGGCPELAQGIAEDGKCMITIARAGGVHWDPLDDLCVKAYRLLDGDFGLPSVKIFLEKLAPVGAGLGGGSADAAFTLKMLSELFGLGLTEDALAGYAARLGSDCAFFIRNRPAFGEGRGEVLSDFELPVLEQYELKVVVPEGLAVSTSEAYRGIVPAVPEIPLREALRRHVDEWKSLIVNDFEKTVFAAHPELPVIKQSLYDSGAVYASMSGSGSALFALYAK